MAEALRVAILDTSPIIGLVAADAIGVLDVLFDRVIVPLVVWEELTDKADGVEPARLAELDRFRLEPRSFPVPTAAEGLDPGERAAIAAAIALAPAMLIVDERDARRVAKSLGLTVAGTVRLLVEAKRAGVIAAVRPALERLSAQGFVSAPS